MTTVARMPEDDPAKFEAAHLKAQLKALMVEREILGALNRDLVYEAAKRSDVFLLRLYLEFFEAGYSSLHKMNWIITQALPTYGYERPETLVSPRMLAMYESLERAVEGIPDDGLLTDMEGVCIAAALGGETNFDLLVSLIEQRRPRSAEEFMEMFSSLQTVAPSISSGAL